MSPRWLTPVPPDDVERGDGDEVTEFIQRFCSVTQDTYAGPAGTPMELRPWQRELLGGVFARRPDGRRRHRVALVGLPRKSGKSALSAGVALHGMFTTVGGEVYSVAADRDQARIVFGHAKRMVETSRALSARCSLYRDVIHLRETGSVYRCLSAEHFCAVPETIVELPDGSRRPVGELAVGNDIIGAQGPNLVNDWVSATGRRPASPCVTVTTVQGRSVTVTTNHPFLVRHRDCRTPDRYEYRPANTLAVGDRVVVGLGWPSDYEGKPLGPGEAWTMGAWVGDGCNTKFRLTNIDEPIIAKTRAFFESIGSGLKQEVNPANRWAVTGVGKHRPSPGREWIRRHFGVTTAGDKRAPEAVFTGTPQDWADFLAGFMDTDGCVPTLRPYVKWSSVSLGLLEDCRALLARLGINGVINPTPAPYRGEVRTYHELRVCGAGQLGRLSGLLHLQHPMKATRLSHFVGSVSPFRAWDSDRVVSITPAGDRETVALSVRNTSAHVTNGLITHNTKEGLSPTLVIFDEVHAQPSDELWHVMSLAQGARIDPLLLGITTAGVKADSTGQDSICYRLYQHGERICSGETDDPSFYMAWWGPQTDDADFTRPDVWQAANPALGDLLDPEDMASAVARTPEHEFRTKRLNQWVNTATAWLPAGAWDRCAEPQDVPDGTDVVLAFDGSFNNDSTALVVCRPGDLPYLDVVQLWERPIGAEQSWTVPIIDVEDAIRAACRRWQVREIVCDPFRWARTYQVLEDERLPVVEFPQSPARMTPATQRFYEAAVNRELRHSGDPRLARHLANAVLKVDSRGQRITKATRNSPRKIDLAVAAVMALDRAAQVQPVYDVLSSVW